MNLRLALTAGVALMLAGCSTTSGYIGTVHPVQMTDDTYRVFEHKQGDRVMVTPSLGATAKLALSHQALAPGPALETPADRMETVARKYLDETGRSNCQITRRELVMQPQYAFYFSCS